FSGEVSCLHSASSFLTMAATFLGSSSPASPSPSSSSSSSSSSPPSSSSSSPSSYPSSSLPSSPSLSLSPSFSFPGAYPNQVVDLIVDSSRFCSPDSILVLCFDPSMQLLFVHHSRRGWELPGGKVE